MELNFWDVLSNLLGLFLLIAVGYAAVKMNIVPAESSAVLTRLLMKIALPCTVFSSLLKEYDPAFLMDVVVVVGIGFVLFLLNAALSGPVSRLMRVSGSRRGVWRFASTFCNNGFMGFPIALALFGEEGLALAAIFGLPFNMLVYTLGARMISSDAVSENGEKTEVKWSSVIFTSVNAATVLGLVCYFGRLTPPTALMAPINHLSNITTPLSMFITGMNLSNGKFSVILRDRDCITASFSRLVLMPLVSFGVLWGFNAVFPFRNPLIFGVLFIIMAMPVAATCSLLSETYHADREFGAACVFISSLLCIITIPVMSLLL